MDLGRSLFAAVFPEFIAREEPGQRGLAVKETSAGWVRPAAAGEDTALRALTASPRWLRSREKVMNLGKDEQRPKGQGMRRNQRRAASAPACRWHAWLDACWPIRHRLFGGLQGAPNAVRRGWAALPIPWRQAQRAGPDQRAGPETSAERRKSPSGASGRRGLNAQHESATGQAPWPGTPISAWNPCLLPRRSRACTMAPVMEPQELQDEELIAQARAWRQRALRGERDARGIAHELEREVRRRFGTSRSDAPQPLPEVPALGVLPQAPQQRWKP